MILEADVETIIQDASECVAPVSARCNKIFAYEGQKFTRGHSSVGTFKKEDV
jgi:hypothetical protein